mmetsp:Transcript_65506/g.135558  ORF Transcript_65506/g.135558 Transcript_65506/m.135558 type:complete len:216 (-) Transcript_65506:57-704(-)
MEVAGKNSQCPGACDNVGEVVVAFHLAVVCLGAEVLADVMHDQHEVILCLACLSHLVFQKADGGGHARQLLSPKGRIVVQVHKADAAVANGICRRVLVVMVYKATKTFHDSFVSALADGGADIGQHSLSTAVHCIGCPCGLLQEGHASLYIVGIVVVAEPWPDRQLVVLVGTLVVPGLPELPIGNVLISRAKSRQITGDEHPKGRRHRVHITLHP